jgi:hypothetical protein
MLLLSLVWALLSSLGNPPKAPAYPVSFAQRTPAKRPLTPHLLSPVPSSKKVGKAYVRKILYDETFGKYAERQRLHVDTLYDADASRILIYQQFSTSLPLFKGSRYQPLLARRLHELLAAEFRRDTYHYKRFTRQQRALLQDRVWEPAVDWSENMVSKALFLVTPLQDSLVGVSITRLYGGKNPPESYRNDDYLFRLVKGRLQPVPTAHWGEQRAAVQRRHPYPVVTSAYAGRIASGLCMPASNRGAEDCNSLQIPGS